MALIIDRPHFKLETTITPCDKGLYSLELKQLHPSAPTGAGSPSSTRSARSWSLRDLIQEALDA